MPRPWKRLAAHLPCRGQQTALASCRLGVQDRDHLHQGWLQRLLLTPSSVRRSGLFAVCAFLAMAVVLNLRCGWLMAHKAGAGLLPK